MMSGHTTVASPPLITTVSPSTAMDSVPLSVARSPNSMSDGKRLADDDVVAEDRVEQLGVGEQRVENVRRDLAHRRVGRSEDRERAGAGELVVERGRRDGGSECRELVEAGRQLRAPGGRRGRRGRTRCTRRADHRPLRRAERWSPTSGRRPKVSDRPTTASVVTAVRRIGSHAARRYCRSANVAREHATTPDRKWTRCR